MGHTLTNNQLGIKIDELTELVVFVTEHMATKEDLSREIGILEKKMDARFSEVDNRLLSLDGRFSMLDKDIKAIRKDINLLKKKVHEDDNAIVSDMYREVRRLDERLSVIEMEFNKHKKKQKA